MDEIELEWLLSWYDPVRESLSNNNAITYDIIWPRNKEELQDPRFELVNDPTIVRFYKMFEWVKIYWETKSDFSLKADGSVDFIAFDRVMSTTWDDDLGGNDWAPDMKGFRPVDSFYDSNGMAGIYVGREDKRGLYLMHSDSSMSPLHVDFDGYLALYSMTKGYGWWQNALVEIATGKPQPNVEGFKENMPKLFPGFDYDAFEARYQSLRIDT